MYISKLSQLGAHVVKNGLKAQMVSTARTLHVPLGQNTNLLSMMRQGFCTTASDKASEKQNEEKEKDSEELQSYEALLCKRRANIYVVIFETWRIYCLQISVTFVDKDGEEKHIRVPVGMSMLEAAHENDIDLEGACEGSLACSTCHVIVMDVNYYNKLEDPTDEENDMLDLAFGLSETSRLGCQIVANPDIDGIRLAIPAATRNFAVDGYKPKPH